MVFSDTTNRLGLIQMCETYSRLGDTKISGVAIELDEFTRRINIANQQTLAWILQSSSSWQHDDANNSDLPATTTELTSGTRDYILPTDLLTVRNIKIKTSGGTYKELERTQVDVTDESLSGEPTSFFLQGSTVRFNRAPNYTQSAGIKVTYDRDADAFADTDTTKTPGFASHLHYGLAVGASLDYWRTVKPGSAEAREFQDMWVQFEAQVRDFYTNRDQDFNSRIQTPYHSFA